MARREASLAGSEDIRDKYDLGEKLGRGGFGEVLEAILKDSRKVRAVKVVDRKEEYLRSKFSRCAMFHNEVAMLQQIHHPNIVRFWDVYQDTDFLYVVMDVCHGGEIFDRVVQMHHFSEVDASIVSSQILRAIGYLHDRCIMHRDIKAENFMFADKTAEASIQMIDFGFACTFKPGEIFSDLVGTVNYMSPELVNRQYTETVDVWAFGVLLFFMLVGRYPFNYPEGSRNKNDVFYKIKQTPLTWKSKDNLSTEAKSLVESLLAKTVAERLTCSRQALKHPWILQSCDQSDDLLNQVPILETDQQHLGEVLRAAKELLDEEKVQKHSLVEEASRLRETRLSRISKDFTKGIRHGHRLGETPQEDFMSRPEFLRRDQRVYTGPSSFMSRTSAALIKADSLAEELSAEMDEEMNLNKDLTVLPSPTPRGSTHTEKALRRPSFLSNLSKLVARIGARKSETVDLNSDSQQKPGLMKSLLRQIS